MTHDYAHVHELTEAQLDILRLMASGLSYAQIAAFRGCAVATVQGWYTQEIFGKLGVNNKTQAAIYAWRNGIVGVDEAWATLQQHQSKP